MSSCDSCTISSEVLINSQTEKYNLYQLHVLRHDLNTYDVVEAHCYIVNIGQTDCQQIHTRINNN